jgi:hypothetical protein
VWVSVVAVGSGLGSGQCEQDFSVLETALALWLSGSLYAAVTEREMDVVTEVGETQTTSTTEPESSRTFAQRFSSPGFVTSVTSVTSVTDEVRTFWVYIVRHF